LTPDCGLKTETYKLMSVPQAFVKKVLAQAKENFERKYHLKSNGFNFEKVLGRVAELLDLKP